jgi:hypothetical protein
MLSHICCCTESVRELFKAVCHHRPGMALAHALHRPLFMHAWNGKSCRHTRGFGRTWFTAAWNALLWRTVKCRGGACSAGFDAGAVSGTLFPTLASWCRVSTRHMQRAVCCVSWQYAASVLIRELYNLISCALGFRGDS